MHYLRMGASLQIVEGEHGPQAVIATSMETHVKMSEYHRQVGVLAVPDQVQLGEVRHLEMQGGHEILLRTNNVYVFPDGKPAVHVPASPVTAR